MPKLRIGTIADDKPVKVTAELPAQVYRDLATYAEALATEAGQQIDPARLIAPMLVRFMASDRGFARVRRAANSSRTAQGEA
ncbi:hypothetical protein GGD63_001068 [Bradyrhizobium sp. cir1]|uniref:DUF2274 domain-containing protein n=1 Tax=Bradyrhizobium sp. cir1 TaxID=1445730 RepID=UPI001606C0A0|nr:DUF2274 domain-containing protein [Bradyrhizobium sp. cir1]MBB4368289.1 hypothetical protein [Bradyrhizobium sp. cir1]